MRGKRKPDHLRALHGEPVPVRPMGDDTRPEPPESMSQPARMAWEQTVNELSRLGLLDRADAGIIAVYVEQLVRHERAAHLLAEWAHLMEPDEIVVWERRLHWSSALIAQHATRLGLTPAARQTMTVEAPERPAPGRLSPERLLN